MKSEEIKRHVKHFRSEFPTKQITSDYLEKTFQQQGFTVIRFNPVINNQDIETVVSNLGLQEMIAHSNGFLYMDNNYRLIFVNEKLNEKERMLVYAHEEGHYYCGHTASNTIIGRSVEEEYEASEFAHYLLEKTVGKRIKDTVEKRKKLLIIAGIIAGLAFGGGTASKEYQERKLYEGEYYVTEHGKKYHRENCVTIQGHETRRMIKEDAKNEKYEPCSVCQPD